MIRIFKAKDIQKKREEGLRKQAKALLKSDIKFVNEQIKKDFLRTTFSQIYLRDKDGVLKETRADNIVKTFEGHGYKCTIKEFTNHENEEMIGLRVYWEEDK